jgi:predicted nucleotidyltransferase
LLSLRNGSNQRHQLLHVVLVGRTHLGRQGNVVAINQDMMLTTRLAPICGIGAAIGAVVLTVGYIGYNAITGRPITWGGVVGAAAGGAVGGAVAGGFVGAATGDASALAVIGGGVLVGAGSGAAGGFVNSIVSQGIDQGRIDWPHVALDTGTGPVLGAALGGVGGGIKVWLRPGPGITPLKVPQGLTQEQFDQASRIIRSAIGHLGDDVIVQGSRAAGTARPTSDIDFAIRQSPEEFEAFVRSRFGTPNPGSAKEQTMLTAIENGRVHAGEAGLRRLRNQLEQALGIKVDIAVIRRGGPFDQGPSIPIPRK